jgi:hypothetical protein
MGSTQTFFKGVLVFTRLLHGSCRTPKIAQDPSGRGLVRRGGSFSPLAKFEDVLKRKGRSALLLKHGFLKKSFNYEYTFVS